MSILPKKLAIFYGWPSTVNGSPDVPTAVSHYQNYDQIVFGQGIEDPSHPDHANTQSIISDPAMANSKVYGYVDATVNYFNLFTAIFRWRDMGVAGIFFDQFGYDFGVSRERQNCLIQIVRYLGLHSFVNAWNPDDVFSSSINSNYNPQGKAPVIDANDIYLAESYQIINGEYQTENDWRVKSDKMIAFKGTYGTQLAAVTTYDVSPFDQTKADYSYYSAVMDGLDSWGWGEENFSASSSQLPFRTRKEVLGTYFTSGTSNNNSVYERSTNVGILIDTNAHTVDTILS